MHPNKEEVESSNLAQKSAWYEDSSVVYSVDSSMHSDLAVGPEASLLRSVGSSRASGQSLSRPAVPPRTSPG